MPIGSFIEGVFQGMDWRERRDMRKKDAERADKRFSWDEANQQWVAEQRDWAREDRPLAKERDATEWGWRVEDRQRAEADRGRAEAARGRAAAERARVEANRNALAADLAAPAPEAGLSVAPAMATQQPAAAPVAAPAAAPVARLPMSVRPGAAPPAPGVLDRLNSFLRSQ